MDNKKSTTNDTPIHFTIEGQQLQCRLKVEKEGYISLTMYDAMGRQTRIFAGCMNAGEYNINYPINTSIPGVHLFVYSSPGMVLTQKVFF